MPLRVSVDDFKRLFGLEPPKPAAAPRKPKSRLPLPHPLSIGQILRPIETRGMKLNKEQALSAELFARLCQLYHAGQLRCTFACIQNELPIPTFTDQLRKMAAMIGLKRRAMGCLPGTPDWAFLWPNGSGWIELKVPGGDKVIREVKRVGYTKLHHVRQPAGRLSDEQRAIQTWCSDTAVNHAVCHSVEQAEAVLRAWGAMVTVEHE
jgi:hypothetical protein